jgi:hypothetical protein
VSENLAMDLGNRVNRLETDMAALASTVEGLARSQNEGFEQLTAALDQSIRNSEDRSSAIQGDIRDLRGDISRSGKVNWGLVVALGSLGMTACALVITIMTVIGSMALAPLAEDVRTLAAASPSTEALKAEARFDHAVIQRLDDTQRSLMVDVGVTESRVTAIEQRLNREVQ